MAGFKNAISKYVLQNYVHDLKNKSFGDLSECFIPCWNNEKQNLFVTLMSNCTMGKNVNMCLLFVTKQMWA